jgi:antibiotic biosynthesis monooxygenase (ABM) superfamily enzyme
MNKADGPVSIVTQTCVLPERAEDFARWQGETSTLISSFPGFIEQRLTPPKPPLQEDWVILQRFSSLEAAHRWLRSPERQSRIEGAAPMLLGRTDVHIVKDAAGAARSAPVTAVMSTRVKPGKEAEYRAWERKIAAAQSKAPGLQGYRFEPAIPGVQDDCVAILRFDTEANLNAWLASPERRKLVDDSQPLVEEFRSRLVNTGFEQWFPQAAESGGPLPVWKMDMIVLLLLYPIVFLWGVYAGVPLLDKVWHLPWAVNLFIGNIFSVALTGFLVPWTANHALAWWLRPKNPKQALATHLLGALVICVIYAASVWVFWKFF